MLGTERSADKVQKIAVAVFPQSSSSSSSSCMLYIVEFCSAAVRRSSSINLGVIRRTRLWHEAHPEHKGGRGAGKPCTGLLLCNTLTGLLCNQHATLHNELNSKKGFWWVATLRSQVTLPVCAVTVARYVWSSHLSNYTFSSSFILLASNEFCQLQGLG